MKLIVTRKSREEMYKEKLKYPIIRDQRQYDRYCQILEDLLAQDDPGDQEEVDLLTLLIEKWEEDNSSFQHSDPVRLLKGLMEEHQLRAKDLVPILDLSKGTISKILNYQKGFSKESIRKLGAYFKVSQEAFNRPYTLHNPDL